MMELYDLAGAEPDRRFSPYCWRARMALAHKELPVTTIPWRFSDKDKIAPSGQGRVPVLVDNGRWIADSWVIANYLEDTYPIVGRCSAAAPAARSAASTTTGRTTC
jgi:glutathione S-transferase